MAQLEPELWAMARSLGLPIVTEFFSAQMASEPGSLHQQGLEDGMFAIEAAQRHGITPGLSVDNETSYSTDMFMEMRVAFCLQRVMGVVHAAERSNIDTVMIGGCICLPPLVMNLTF